MLSRRLRLVSCRSDLFFPWESSDGLQWSSCVWWLDVSLRFFLTVTFATLSHKGKNRLWPANMWNIAILKSWKARGRSNIFQHQTASARCLAVSILFQGGPGIGSTKRIQNRFRLEGAPAVAMSVVLQLEERVLKKPWWLLAILYKRRPQKWVRQTAPLLVPRK